MSILYYHFYIGSRELILERSIDVAVSYPTVNHYQEKHGKVVSHPKAMELLVAFAAGEVDKLYESK